METKACPCGKVVRQKPSHTSSHDSTTHNQASHQLTKHNETLLILREREQISSMNEAARQLLRIPKCKVFDTFHEKAACHHSLPVNALAWNLSSALAICKSTQSVLVWEALYYGKRAEGVIVNQIDTSYIMLHPCVMGRRGRKARCT